MKTLYLDCFSGIAGDMFLGALLDLGLETEEFKKKLQGLNLNGFEISASRVKRNGFMGTDVKIIVQQNDDECKHDHHHEHAHCHEHDLGIYHEHAHDHNHGYDHLHAHEHEHEHHHVHGHSHRGLNEIRAIVEKSSLSVQVKEQSIKAFQLLAEAEGAVHGIAPEEVHFHEVGAVDSIVDIVGSFILLEMLRVDRVCASPVNVGSGTVTCAHGILPVPAPATARLLEGIPVYSRGGQFERTTPTGALLLRVLSSSFGPAPDGKILASGYGFGDRESNLPNMLRVMLIEEATEKKDLPYSEGKVAIMETNIDDMSPQDYMDLEERLFKAGALDVFFTSIMMKKMRPAVRLSCIAPLEKREAFGEIILRYSSSIGVRWSESNRMTLSRKIQPFESSYGSVAMKSSCWGNEPLRVTPEYEDLHRISSEKNIPLNELRTKILAEFYAKEDR